MKALPVINKDLSLYGKQLKTRFVRRTAIFSQLVLVLGSLAYAGFNSAEALGILFPVLLACVLLTAVYFVAKNASNLELSSHALALILILVFAYLSYSRENGIYTAIVIVFPFLAGLTASLFKSAIALGYAVFISVTIVILSFLHSGLVIRVPDEVAMSYVVWLVVMIGATSWASIYLVGINYKLTRALKDRGDTDFLTGLYNRHVIAEMTRGVVLRGKRSMMNLGVLLIDIDHFKQYNELQGYEAGDRVLVELANIVCSVCECSDSVVFRFAGDEFLVVISSKKRQEVEDIARQICSRMNSLQIRFSEEGDSYLSASAGIVFGDQYTSIEKLIGLADKGIKKVEDLDKITPVS